MTEQDESGRPVAETAGEPADDARTGAESSHPRRAALAVSALLVASSALGLVRDLSVAGLFGASGDTDAFLVAWTIPETVSVLLMEGAMSYLLVPVFVREVTRAGHITRVVRETLLPLLVILGLAAVVTAAAAPVFVDVLAPGIGRRTLAIQCFRLASFTIFFMGLAGYLMAGLRANSRFAYPASVYVVYNVGILTTMYWLHGAIGILSAALGLAVGSALMVLVQSRAFLSVTTVRGSRLRITRRLLLASGAFLPIAAYSMGRQGQVFVERIVASTLEAGSISYMNYASKVAQMASLLALTTAAVAFPSIARVASDPVAFRHRTESEFRRVMLLILPALAFIFFFAEPCIRVLFERGRFDAGDVRATSSVMQVYCLGLAGQVCVSLGVFVWYSQRHRLWFPATAAGVGLVITAVVDVTLAPVLDVKALAAGNAVGITVTGVLIWVGIRRVLVDVDLRRLVQLMLVVGLIGAGAALAARAVCGVTTANPYTAVLLGAILTVTLHLSLTAAVGVPESRELVVRMRSVLGRSSAR